jgi:hypothetical protein
VSINLPDLRQAVLAYLASKVTVTVEDPVPTDGTKINPKESFNFKVRARNAPAPDGIQLTNVRYQVSVPDKSDHTGGATVRVPPFGTALDGEGHRIDVGKFVPFFEWNPTGPDHSTLEVGEEDAPALTGKVGPRAGTFKIKARILADPDLGWLFPRNFRSTEGTNSVNAEET